MKCHGGWKSNHRALTRGIFNWEISIRWTLDLLIPVHFTLLSLLYACLPSMTSFVALTLPKFMYDFRPRCALSVQLSLNRLCHLKTRLLETPLSLSVHFSFLKVSVGVMPVCTQNWIAVRRAFPSSNVDTFTRFLFQRPPFKGAPFSNK